MPNINWCGDIRWSPEVEVTGDTVLLVVVPECANLSAMRNAEVAKVQNLIWRGDICLWWHCKEGSEHCTHHGRLKPSSETNLKTCKKAPTSNKHGPELLKQGRISCCRPTHPVLTRMQTHWNQAWTRRGGIVCSDIEVREMKLTLRSQNSVGSIFCSSPYFVINIAE